MCTAPRVPSPGRSLGCSASEDLEARILEFCSALAARKLGALPEPAGGAAKSAAEPEGPAAGHWKEQEAEQRAAECGGQEFGTVDDAAPRQSAEQVAQSERLLREHQAWLGSAEGAKWREARER